MQPSEQETNPRNPERGSNSWPQKSISSCQITSANSRCTASAQKSPITRKQRNAQRKQAVDVCEIFGPCACVPKNLCVISRTVGTLVRIPLETWMNRAVLPTVQSQPVGGRRAQWRQNDCLLDHDMFVRVTNRLPPIFVFCPTTVRNKSGERV
jgi:hypothetical protein